MKKRQRQSLNLYDLSSVGRVFKRKRLLQSEKRTIRARGLYDLSSRGCTNLGKLSKKDIN